MNINVKLILLGLLAMILTVLVFTAIEVVVVNTGDGTVTDNQPVQSSTQVAAVNTVQPAFTSAPNRTLYSPPTQSLLLTLPAEPFSSTSTPTGPATLTNTPEASPDPSTKGTPSTTADAGLTPTAGTPTSTDLPSGTASIQGRVLFNGGLFSGTIVLKLVDPVSTEIQQFTFMDGEYNLRDLQPSTKGYQVVFSREDNLQLNQNQVVSQVMVGPLPAEDGALVRYPDFDIALLGLEPLEPEPDTVFSDHAITPQQPLRFEWSDYPSLSQYQLELKPGRLSQPIWASGFLDTESVVFDGVLSNGALIERGTYWWSVSARSANGMITAVGPAAELTLDW
jgi:hypothetical protein